MICLVTDEISHVQLCLYVMICLVTDEISHVQHAFGSLLSSGGCAAVHGLCRDVILRLLHGEFQTCDTLID